MLPSSPSFSVTLKQSYMNWYMIWYVLFKSYSSAAHSPIHLPFTAQKKPVTTMLTYPWKCTVLHCNHLGNTWKPLVLMTRHFDYCPSASEGDNQSVRSSAPVVSRCFPGGYNVKRYISRGRLAWWLLVFLHSASYYNYVLQPNPLPSKIYIYMVCIVA